jgi:hypothetical protein
LRLPAAVPIQRALTGRYDKASGNGHNRITDMLVTVMPPLRSISRPPCTCRRRSPSHMQPGIVHPGNDLGNDRKILSTIFVDKSVDETLEKPLRAYISSRVIGLFDFYPATIFFLKQ